MHFCSFWAKYWPSDPFGAIPDQKNNANEVPRVFFYMLVPELLLPPKIIKMYGPKTAVFAPEYAFLGTYRPHLSVLYFTHIALDFCNSC